MSKKDYIAIAKIIKQNTMSFKHKKMNSRAGSIQILIMDFRLIDELCSILKADNPLFDKKKFKRTCGL